MQKDNCEKWLIGNIIDPEIINKNAIETYNLSEELKKLEGKKLQLNFYTYEILEDIWEYDEIDSCIINNFNLEKEMDMLELFQDTICCKIDNKIVADLFSQKLEIIY